MKLNYVLSYTKDNKHFAIAIETHDNSNLFYVFKGWEKHYQLGDLNIIHYVSSKKKAEDLARFWNNCYRQNGTLLTDF